MAYTEEEKAAFRANQDKINAALDIVDKVFEALNAELGGDVAFFCMVDAGAGGATASNVGFADGVKLVQRCLNETARALQRANDGEDTPMSPLFRKQ